ncbi:Uma2 family endonuclease [Thermomonospora cellulosilytica]|uniref:Uma2 family endonuclease n=1 Tax=Thermomonospora cellulosilytica TaxID=1411118 RepID=A0A7W3RAH2_9ACTN|nr:Uma2 family endonuclease [Thermomonospora cellulosilytica]MBA9005851.1 Uma2 family endonuclease [Thermomonospora cellulosilytica]
MDTIAPLPDWLIPPPDGFTVDGFLRMEGLPRHTELIDGSLVFAAPQTKWHSRVITLLLEELDAQAPDELRADREMTVILAKRQAPQPDVLVVTRDAYERQAPSTHYFPEDLVLAVEAVTPDSEDRDRDTKPRKYAAAGIRHFWRVENDGGRTVVYVYELDPATGGYALTGIHRDRLAVTVPYALTIDLTQVGRRSR